MHERDAVSRCQKEWRQLDGKAADLGRRSTSLRLRQCRLWFEEGESEPFARPTEKFAISSMFHTVVPMELQRAKVVARR